MSESESNDSSSRGSRGARVKKKRRRERRTGHESAIFRALPDLLILLALILSFVLLFGASAGPLDQAGGSWRRFLEPLVGNRVGAVPGAILLIMALVAAGFRLRWRINHNRRLWMRRCPACGSQDLRRVRRIRRDRLLGLLGIPVRRYVCPECRWLGARIDQRNI